MKLRLKYKLILSYIFIALFCAITILIIIHLLLQKEFQRYISKNQEISNQEIVSMVTDSFGEDGSVPELTTLQYIGQIALRKGIVLQVESYDTVVNWCMHCESYELCHSMLEQMKYNTDRFLSNQEGHTVYARYEIIKRGVAYGFVNLEYYGPISFSDSDVKFMNVINQIFAYGIIVSIFVAIAVGLIMARNIARPVQLIAKQTEEIEHGNYGAILKIKSSTLEVENLVQSVNRLGFTLARQREMRKRMIGNYAHEFRTPLAILQTNLEAMIDGIWEADCERLNSCNDEIIRLTRMLGRMDELMELEQETILLDRTEFPLLKLMEEAAFCFEGEIHKKQLTLSLNKEDIQITADRDRLEQVVMNLLSNAIKYTEVGGHIEMGVRKSKTHIILHVKDNGIGMESEELPYIFDYLYRIDKSRSNLESGSGIGLSIVHAIVVAHGGYIEVESKPRKGSNFMIYLPVYHDGRGGERMYDKELNHGSMP